MEVHEILWSDNSHRWDLDQALMLIQQKQQEHGADAVIVVTHLEYCDYLPTYAYRAIKKERKDFSGLEKGEMLVLDFA